MKMRFIVILMWRQQQTAKSPVLVQWRFVCICQRHPRVVFSSHSHALALALAPEHSGLISYSFYYYFYIFFDRSPISKLVTS